MNEKPLKKIATDLVRPIAPASDKGHLDLSGLCNKIPGSCAIEKNEKNMCFKHDMLFLQKSCVFCKKTVFYSRKHRTKALKAYFC